MVNDRIHQHIVFAAEFMQMMEDFFTESHCPACRKESRSNLICLNDDCDFMLFPAPGKIHPAFFKIVEEKTKELSK